MIRQPKRGSRNVSDYFYKAETERIAKLNEVFGSVDLTAEEEKVLIWLAGLDNWTIDNAVSAIKKAVSVNSKVSVHEKLKQETVHGRLERFQRETKEKGADSPKQREDRQEER